MKRAVAMTDPAEWPLKEDLQPVFERFAVHLRALKADGRLPSLPSEEILPFSAHYLGLRELAELLGIYREELASLRQPAEPTLEAARQIPGTFIENFWIHNGIKGGLVTVLALVLVDWLKPPGGTMIPLAAWIFTILSRVFLRWQGDRRSFQYAFITAILGIPYLALLLVLAPVLSSYAAANALIFACFFVFGYLCIQLKGITFWMQVGMFGVISAIGLNPQSPVGFPQIVDAYFGIVIAMFLSAIVQRFLWPVTPPIELRHSLDRFLEACRNLLRHPADPRIHLWRKQIALASSQAAAWAEQFTTPEFPEGEREKWQAALATLRATADQLRVCMKDAFLPEFGPLIALMRFKPIQYRERHDAILAEFQEVINGRRPAETLAIAPEMPLVDEFKRLRDARAFADFDMDLVFHFYGHIARCQRLHLETQDCIDRLKSLKLERYMGDFAL
ncbi:MAG TPA: FUSC family protein, partial [Chthoniobacterales bacterium]